MIPKVGGNELRIGSGGVPLAVAPDLYRRVIVNGEPPRKVYGDLELSGDVGKRMLALLRRHRLPSKERLIVLSLGYPERSHADIASAFRVTVDQVLQCEKNASSIRRNEPLSTELWEDITDDDLTQAEIAARAAHIRRMNDAVVKGEVLERPWSRAQGREGVGDPSADRARPGRCERREARPAGSQPKEGLLSNARCGGGSRYRNQAPQPGVHQPK